MLTCLLQGGLGNQLFQIFTTISYSLKYNKPFVFSNQLQLDTKRSTYWHSFLLSLAKFTKEINYYNKDIIKLQEQNFSYNVLPNINVDKLLLFGYFQSYKYFEEHANKIMYLIKLEKQKQIVKNKYNINTNSISIHIRRGDYKNLQDYHPLMTYEYYSKALKHILYAPIAVSLAHALIFCEKNDLPDILDMIEQFKKPFNTINFQIIDFNISDWEQLLLMSLCHHNIIANSSYSWWGAYLNTNPNKIVCYPDEWFGPKLCNINNTKDLCPPDWVKIIV